jgi:AbiV family abortive infection protein
MAPSHPFAPTASVEESLEGARHCLENAESLLASAETLAEDDRFGYASGLLVLVGEEAMRSRVYFCKHRHVLVDPLAEETVQDLRCQRSSRLVTAALAVLTDYMAEILRRKAEQGARQNGASQPAETRLQGLLTRLERYRSAHPETASFHRFDARQARWWRNTEPLMRRSFYVTYGADGWARPSDLTADAYRQSREVAVDMLMRTAEGISRYQQLDEDEQRELDRIDQQFLRAVVAE